MTSPSPLDSRAGVSVLRLMSSACAGMFVFGIVMAVLGAILPSLFDRIRFDKSAAGNLFLYMNSSSARLSTASASRCFLPPAPFWSPPPFSC